MPPAAHEARAANLRMYDAPEWAGAVDAFWARVVARLRAHGLADIPDRLTRDRALDDIWTDPRLLLAQTCGWPLVTRLAGRVAVVATPRHTLPGCAGATHRAFIVVRADDPVDGLAALRGRRFALNGWDSNTGMNLARALFAPLARDGRFFGAIVVTGAHRASLAAVAEGRADAASVDCVTYGLLCRHAPGAVAGLRVLAETPATPALPFITRAGAPPNELAALRAALDQPDAALAFAGVTVLPDGTYDALSGLAAAAARLGYPTLS